MAGEVEVQAASREGRRRKAPSGTVTFLFTDIEGSTRLLERLRGRYAEVLDDQRRLLRGVFDRWHGHEIDTQGDSFFVAFPRASDAVNCAIEAQRELAAWRWPEGVEVRVRMGIHTGEPLVAGRAYVGMDVHRAARIAAAGHGGQVLVSGTAHDLVVDDLPDRISLVDLGSHRLKDVRSEVRLYQLSGPGLLGDFGALVTGSADEPPPTHGEPPYRGLQAFEEEDAALFFGRERVIGELDEQVAQARFVALVGASGSGKSSILRAGIVPSLRQRQWQIYLLTPTAHPLEALAEAVAPDAAPAAISSLVDQLRGDPRSLAVMLRPRVAAGPKTGQRTLIAIDQLEEVFTLCRDEAERRAFLDALIHACGLDEGPADQLPDGDRATVVVTLRADFYAFLAPFPPLRDAAAASQRYVGAMSADELRRAIEEPARRGGWDFTPGLVDLLLRDVGEEPGALPLLSHALLETWRRRRGTLMTLRSYDEAGGVNGAIARTADRVYDTELSADQQRLARNIFVRLTELGEGTQDTRRRVLLDELIPSDPSQAAEVRSVIGALAAARLVTVDEATIEVAHEALIREWPRLREWLSGNREALRVHRRLTETAREWEASGFDDSLLYRGARLAQIRDSTAYTGTLNELEQRFVDASVAAAEREEMEREAARERELAAAQAVAAAEAQRAEEAARSAASLRRRALLLVIALFGVAVLAGVAFVLAQQSDANATLAQQHADEARQNADEARQNADLAERSAQEARDNAALADDAAREARDKEAEARDQATQAFVQRLGADANQVLLGGGDPELAALLALNGLNAGYTPESDSALQRAGRQISDQVFSHPADVSSVALTPDGETLFTLADDQIWVWDVASGTVRMTLPSPSPHNDYPYLQLSALGTTLMVSEYGGSGGLYDVQDGRITQIAMDCPALTTDVGVRAMSADGNVLATYLYAADPLGKADEVVFVSLPDCAPIGGRILAPGLNDPALSDDGSLLVGSVADNTATYVWNTATGALHSTLDGGPVTYWHPAFSHKGDRVATGTFDGVALSFDADSGELLRTFRGHSAAVERVSFSLDDSRLVTSSDDGTARLWDSFSANQLRRFVVGAPVNEAVLSSDGGRLFAAADDGTARQWASGGEESTVVAGEDEVSGLAFSPDGTRLAAADGDSIDVYDTATYELVYPPVPHRGPSLVRYSPTGDRLLVSSPLGTVLLNASDGSVQQTLSTSDEFGDASAIGFSADGSRILAGLPTGGQSVLLYDAYSGNELAPPYPATTAVLSPDGTRAAGWSPGRYSIYEADTGRILKSYALNAADQRWVDLAYTPDGTRIVTGDHDNVVRVRDANSLEVLLEMPGHSSAIRQVAVSADGRVAISSSDDGTARLWDLQSGKLLRVFPGHEGRAVTSIAISPDAGSVAIGSSNGSVIVTPTSGQEWTAMVCGRLTRDLTPDERVAYGIDEAAEACPGT